MNKSLNILITDDVHEDLLLGLKHYGLRYTYLPKIQPHEIPKTFEGHNGLVVRSKIRLDSATLEKLPGLRIIARAGAGTETIDEAYTYENDIKIISAGEGNRDAVGEHTVGMILHLLNKFGQGFEQIKLGIWDREANRGEELSEKTVGIIGFGNTGSAVSEKLQAMGCQILAYDKYKSGYAEHGVVETDLPTLLHHADILSFHIPLTTETRGIINGSLIDSVSKPFMLLNMSRGGIMNTRSITKGLDSGKIKAFGADVLENENLESYSLDENELLKNLAHRPNVLLTPHVGGWTKESYKKISQVILRKILAFTGIEATEYDLIKLDRDNVR